MLPSSPRRSLSCLWNTAVLASALLLGSLTLASHAAAPPSSTVAGPTTPLNDAASDDIRDIRGPKAVAPVWLIPAIAAAVVALALAAYAFWRWRRRQRPARPLLPFELALQRLEAIRSLMQPARVREFSIAITDIVRAYIEQRFDVTATHRTTEEFLHDLLKSSHTTLAAHRDLLAQFLEQCDLAKFAGMSLSQPAIESLHASARTFVLATAKPDPEPNTPGAQPVLSGAPHKPGTASASNTAPPSEHREKKHASPPRA